VFLRLFAWQIMLSVTHLFFAISLFRITEQGILDCQRQWAQVLGDVPCWLFHDVRCLLLAGYLVEAPPNVCTPSHLAEAAGPQCCQGT